MREPPNVPVEHLRAGLRDHFGLADVSLEFLPVGLDANAGVFRVLAARAGEFLLKVKRGPIYPASRLAPRHLVDQGIAEVVAPLPTTRGDLWSAVGASSGWVLTLYPFIAGATGWTPPMTDHQWRALGTALKHIHGAPLPMGGIPTLRMESFDVAEYSRQVAALDMRYTHAAAAQASDHVERTLIAHWTARRPAFLAMLTAMEQLAAILRRRAGPRVICHADLHPGNIIRDLAGRVHIIDWDDVMLAPKERDFLFVADPSDCAEGADALPFFQGYGPAAIDWIALTYYLFERSVTDVIAYAEEVSVIPDLGESDRAESARRFSLIFASGYSADAAWAAASRLPLELRIARDEDLRS
ncbi:MAG TPA: aminoglycoside phosphotransferase family protein [Ktedonobacterales bacterium]|nr:aminoglycoside phosphotransferase family protein [Ktedonobacterales bacterium]